MANGSPAVGAQPGMAVGGGSKMLAGGQQRARVRGGTQGKNGVAAARIAKRVAENGVGPEGGRQVAGQLRDGVGAEEVEVQGVMSMEADGGQSPADSDCEGRRLTGMLAW